MPNLFWKSKFHYSIFTACCYAKPVASDDLQNDSIMMVIEKSHQNKLASMTCLEKILNGTVKNVIFWKSKIDSSSLEFTEAVKRLFLRFMLFIYLKEK